MASASWHPPASPGTPPRTASAPVPRSSHMRQKSPSVLPYAPKQTIPFISVFGTSSNKKANALFRAFLTPACRLAVRYLRPVGDRKPENSLSQECNHEIAQTARFDRTVHHRLGPRLYCQARGNHLQRRLAPSARRDRSKWRAAPERDLFVCRSRL